MTRMIGADHPERTDMALIEIRNAAKCVDRQHGNPRSLQSMLRACFTAI
jgi:hypothetical protein